jgi:hypothetical protein
MPTRRNKAYVVEFVSAKDKIAGLYDSRLIATKTNIAAIKKA